jgi:hypothetical protein
MSDAEAALATSPRTSNTKTGPADPGHKLAAYLLEYLAGKKSDDNLSKYWDKAFPDANG